MEIALRYGFLPGGQMPGHVAAGWLYFADQDWKRPNRPAYMAALARERPVMATVLDWEREEQLSEVLDWAEEAAQYVRRYVQIIPKVIGGIARLPKQVGGKDVVLGFSVPTPFGGGSAPLWEYAGWPVHLLGGPPHRQIRLWHQFSAIADVISADGNMLRRRASNLQVWVPGTAYQARNRYWPTLTELGIGRVGREAHLRCFEWSCRNAVRAWLGLASEVTS